MGIRYWIKKSTELLIPRRPFQRLVREIGQDHKTDLRFAKLAFLALQEAAEEHVTNVLESGYDFTIERHQVTIAPKDIKAARRLLAKWGIHI